MFLAALFGFGTNCGEYPILIAWILVLGEKLKKSISCHCNFRLFCCVFLLLNLVFERSQCS